MKKTIITTILILILGVGLPATQVLSAPESGAQNTQENAKQAVERKDKQARAKLTELLERAAAMLKDEESAK